MLLFVPRVTISTVMQLTEDLLTTFGNYIVLGILVYILLNLFFYVVIIRSGNTYYIKNVKKALIVTAHPDDESMFFGPVILKLVSDKCRVYLLCLCPGHYYKKGWWNKDELWSSCEVLGIPSSNILLIKNENIEDDPKLKVTVESVAHTILSYVEQYEIDTIITFDKDGVSGHKNHVALFYSISFLCVRAVLPEYCKVYILESVGFFRKYVGFMDSMYSYLNSKYIYFNSIPESKKLAVAMAAHNSQFVWHRRVYINISRYMYINSFTEMHIFTTPVH